MKTGDLEHRITLQELVETNTQGSLTQAWTTVDTVWAKVISQRGSEAFESARANARETIRIMMRYREINIKWRLVWFGQNYHIKHIDRSMVRRGELWITAELSNAA